MYYLLHRNQLHVSALFFGHLQVDNEKLNKQFTLDLRVNTRKSSVNCLLSFLLST